VGRINIIETIFKLGALEARTNDVANYVERVEVKIDDLINRLARLEANQENMKQSLRNEILADIKADITRVQVRLDYEQQKNAPKTQKTTSFKNLIFPFLRINKRNTY